MCSKFQYVGVVPIIILKEDFLQWCLKISGLETVSLDEQTGFQGQANTEVRPFRLTSSSWKV